KRMAAPSPSRTVLERRPPTARRQCSVPALSSACRLRDDASFCTHSRGSGNPDRGRIDVRFPDIRFIDIRLPAPRFGEDERMTSPTVHASAVLVGARAVLIRGPSGAGKSRLALDLLATHAAGRPCFARLVGDDRVLLERAGGRLLVRPAASLAGLLEVRG